MRKLFLVASACAVATAAPPDVPPVVFYWDMDASLAPNTKEEKLTYEEQVLAFTFQGLMNERGSPPELFFNAGFLDFDWPSADPFWRSQLQDVYHRVTFTNLTSTICGLIDGVDLKSQVTGLVQYENGHPFGTGYTMPMALTLASQEGLLPVTSDVLSKHPCLSKFPVKRDLRISKMSEMASRSSAWRWAVDTLLPKASKATVFNIYHYGDTSKKDWYKHDPQSNATVGNLDYAVASKAFVTDLDPDDKDDAALLVEIFGRLDPLFDAFGWAHNEHSWTRAVSRGGGTVFCSFASPNLSFWAILALDPSSPGGGKKARHLPSGDAGRALDRSKYYVTFETNEGDTPRIVVSAFGSSWANPQRGSIPVAWSVDPILAERFPSLMDFYASTAKANDSFIGGVAGAGYAYLNDLTEAQLQRYATRVGRLYHEYGPSVADTYGSANLSTIAKYSNYAAQGGMRPDAFVSQPLWAYGPYAENSYKCPVLNMYSPADGTPIICTAHTPSLFYRNRNISQQDPGKDLAGRIRSVAAQYKPPFFVTVYGGLKWTDSAMSTKTEFFALLHATMANLGSDYVAIGASEMARLAKLACNATGNGGNPNRTKTCASTSAQHDCSPTPGGWAINRLSRLVRPGEWGPGLPSLLNVYLY
jgi:hypothetical protein